MRLIYAEDCKDLMYVMCAGQDKAFVRAMEQVIADCPTADAVPVVRCKDCKWYQEGKLLAPNKFCFRLKHPKEDRKIGYNYAPDDFCSYGEPRGERKE